ncbi:MAG: hypothetical protein EHM72_17000, partial [Calditrichaeota bacterium]
MSRGNMGKFIQLFFLVSILSISGFPANPDVKFEYLTTVDGLPSNYINVIFQDSFGFLWFGTRNGLVRYDGYNFKIYQPEISSYSISGRGITSIHEDKNGNLWIGTDFNGLNKFDRKKERFIHFKHDPLDSTSLRSNNIWTCYLDSSGYLWVVYADFTPDILNTTSGRVSPVQYGFDRSGIGRN